MYSLALANQLDQEVTIDRAVIGAQIFECPDIECGAVFSYRRVSCGHFVQPQSCPTCVGPMEDAEVDGLVIVDRQTVRESRCVSIAPLPDRDSSGKSPRT
jgi:predicted RNA-binding Zn-ribbon protein involved in translation (DUF1610 family)